LNAFPYCGRTDPFLNNTDDLQGEFIVKKFADPYLNKGYHITTDNFFSSLRLAQFLQSKKTKENCL